MSLSDYGLLDEFSARGRWWLPNNRGDGIPGTLNFSDGRIQLELDGVFSVPELELPNLVSSPTIFSSPAILGETTEGDACTVFRAAAYHASPGHLRLRGNALIVGGHWPEESKLEIQKAVLGFAHLDEWAYHKLIQQSSGANRDSYNFVVPTEAKTLLHVEDVAPMKDLKLMAGLEVKFERTKTSLVNRNYFLLEFAQPLNLSALREVVRTIGNLLSLLVGEAVPAVKIRLVLTEHAQPPRPSVDYFLGLKTQSATKRSEFDMPLPLAALGDASAKTLFKNWFLNEDRLRPVYGLLVSTIYDPDQYVQSTFLSLAQALETFHRRFYDGIYVPKDEYKETRQTLVRAIPSNTPEKLADKLKAMLNWGNEFSLRDRLTELLKSLNEQNRTQLMNWNAVEDFVRTVADIRNYLSHYKESSKPAVTDNLREMYNLNQCLRAILTVILLRHLGMEERMVAQAFGRHLHLGY
jgi:HEPN superfamily Apea-like protein/ApeA-like protein